MGKWMARNQSKRRGKDDWVVYDEFGWIKCSALSEDTARQIAREHNAHEERVGLLRRCLDAVEFGMRFSIDEEHDELIETYVKLHEVLALAEGRE